MEQVSFTDSNGVHWVVREDGAQDPLLVDAGERFPGAAWLKFESDLEVRRLWHYPDDWRGLSPMQLESLLDRASTVIARFRPVRHSRVDPAPDGRPSAPPPSPAQPARAGDPVGAPRRGRTGHEDPDSR